MNGKNSTIRWENFSVHWSAEKKL